VIVLVPALKIMGYIGLAQLLMDFEFYIKIQENAALDEQTSIRKCGLRLRYE